MNWLDVLTPYDFVARTALAIVLVSYGAYVMLRAGVFAVPQIGFMAIGAYVSAILATKYHQPLIVTFFVALAVTSVFAVLLALVVMRLDGIRLAIATIAFSEIVRIVIGNLEITGGATGIVGVPRRTEDWQLLLLVAITAAFFARLGRTKYGAAMDAIRGDASVASHQGISIRNYRLGVFVLSALTCSAGGVMQVHMSGFIEPDLFTFSLLTQVLAVAILGGMTAFAGPLLGALVIFSAPELLAPLASYRILFNGVVIILVMAIAPGGLAEILNRAARSAGIRPRRTRKATTTSGRAEVVPGGVRPAAAADAAVLEITGLHKHYGGLKAIDNLSLEVRPGELFGIIGPNGSGKTTLLNMISGAISCDKGTVSIAGKRINRFGGRPEKVARLGVSRTFQGIRLLRDMTVRENIRLGTYCVGAGNVAGALLGIGRAAADRRRADRQVVKALDRLGILSEADSHVGGLPYGVQRRVEIARASVQEPLLILLDEPTAGMTPTETSNIFSYLLSLCSEGCTVLIIEHDLHAMTRYCDRVAVLNHGSLLALGKPSEVMKRQEVIEAYVGRTTVS